MCALLVQSKVISFHTSTMVLLNVTFKQQSGGYARGRGRGRGGCVRAEAYNHMEVLFTHETYNEGVEFRYIGHGSHRCVYEGRSSLGHVVLKLGNESSKNNLRESHMSMNTPSPCDKFKQHLPHCWYYGPFTSTSHNKMNCVIVKYCGKTLDQITSAWPLDVWCYVYLEMVTDALSRVIVGVQSCGGYAADVHWGKICVSPVIEQWRYGATVEICIVDSGRLGDLDEWSTRSVGDHVQDIKTPLECLVDFVTRRSPSSTGVTVAQLTGVAAAMFQPSPINRDPTLLSLRAITLRIRNIVRDMVEQGHNRMPRDSRVAVEEEAQVDGESAGTAKLRSTAVNVVPPKRRPKAISRAMGQSGTCKSMSGGGGSSQDRGASSQSSSIAGRSPAAGATVVVALPGILQGVGDGVTPPQQSGCVPSQERITECNDDGHITSIQPLTMALSNRDYAGSLPTPVLTALSAVPVIEKERGHGVTPHHHVPIMSRPACSTALPAVQSMDKEGGHGVMPPCTAEEGQPKRSVVVSVQSEIHESILGGCVPPQQNTAEVHQRQHMAPGQPLNSERIAGREEICCFTYLLSIAERLCPDLLWVYRHISV